MARKSKENDKTARAGTIPEKVQVTLSSHSVQPRPATDRGGDAVPVENLQRKARSFFEEGGLQALFSHVQYLVFGALVLAAGSHAAVEGDSARAWGIFNMGVTGWAVMGIGAFLIVLNLMDGLRRLGRLKRGLALQILLVLAYLVISLRVVHLVGAYYRR